VCCYCDCHAWVGTPLSRPSFTAYTPSDQEVKLTSPLIPFLTLKWHLLRFSVVQQERTRRHLALYYHLTKRPSYPPITDHSIMNKPMRGRTPSHSLIPPLSRLVDVRHRNLGHMSFLLWRHPLFIYHIIPWTLLSDPSAWNPKPDGPFNNPHQRHPLSSIKLPPISAMI